MPPKGSGATKTDFCDLLALQFDTGGQIKLSKSILGKYFLLIFGGHLSEVSYYMSHIRSSPLI